MMRIAMALLIFITVGCSQVQTGSKIDSATDFSTLKTFGWLHDVDKEAEDVRLNDPQVRQTVRTAKAMNGLIVNRQIFWSPGSAP